VDPRRLYVCLQFCRLFLKLEQDIAASHRITLHSFITDRKNIGSNKGLGKGVAICLDILTGAKNSPPEGTILADSDIVL